MAFVGVEFDRVEQLLAASAKIGDHLGVAPVVLARTLEYDAQLARVADKSTAAAFLGERADPAAMRARLHADKSAWMRAEKSTDCVGRVLHLLLEDYLLVFVDANGLVMPVAEVETDRQFFGRIVHGCSPRFGY